MHSFHLELYPELKEYNFPYIVGVGEYLPLKSNTFDISITTASVDHYYNPVDVFHEIFRCLRPESRLYIMISKDADSIKSNLPTRICEYYRRNGPWALGKEMASRMCRMLCLKGGPKVNTHVHHFRSIEEVLRLLYMFNIVRSKEAKEHNQFYIECVKES